MLSKVSPIGKFAHWSLQLYPKAARNPTLITEHQAVGGTSLEVVRGATRPHLLLHTHLVSSYREYSLEMCYLTTLIPLSWEEVLSSTRGTCPIWSLLELSQLPLFSSLLDPQIPSPGVASLTDCMVHKQICQSGILEKRSPDQNPITQDNMPPSKKISTHLTEWKENQRCNETEKWRAAPRTPFSRQIKWPYLPDFLKDLLSSQFHLPCITLLLHIPSIIILLHMPNTILLLHMPSSTLLLHIPTLTRIKLYQVRVIRTTTDWCQPQEQPPGLQWLSVPNSITLWIWADMWQWWWTPRIS